MYLKLARAIYTGQLKPSESGSLHCRIELILLYGKIFIIHCIEIYELIRECIQQRDLRNFLCVKIKVG